MTVNISMLKGLCGAGGILQPNSSVSDSYSYDIVVLEELPFDAFADSSERLGSSAVKQRMYLCFFRTKIYSHLSLSLFSSMHFFCKVLGLYTGIKLSKPPLFFIYESCHSIVLWLNFSLILSYYYVVVLFSFRTIYGKYHGFI